MRAALLVVLLAGTLAAAHAAAKPAQLTLPAWAENLPSAPEQCTADIINSIQWGSATSAYQVEGAWDADGKSPSVWDVMAQTPGKIADNSSGNVAIDMYHRWEEDIALMKALGVKNYRMSISWPRIVPEGVAGSPINMAGVQWYRRFILALLQAGIKPAVTLYHWDLPQVLQSKYQGFMSAQVQDDFLYYADAVFAHLGDLVDQWMTFNEVISICELGYERDAFAPQMKLGVRGKYVCGHNIILAHAKTVQMYRQKYKPTQNGRLSIALDGKWGYPQDPNNPADVQAADNFMQFQFSWIADPLYFGDYPQIMRDTQGSDLPSFTDAEKELLKSTTIDLFSVNFYCGYYVWAPKAGAPKAQTFTVGDPLTSPGVPTNAPWLFKNPDGLRKTLVWLNKRYNGPEFWITENGVSGPGEEYKARQDVLRDEFRLDYYKTYLANLCLAKSVDGVKVTNYFAWSIFDNFEWASGWTNRFGLVYIDMNDNLSRHPKATAYWFSKYFFNAAPLPTFSAKQRQAAATYAASKAGINRGVDVSMSTAGIAPALKPLAKVAVQLGGKPLNTIGNAIQPSAQQAVAPTQASHGFALPFALDINKDNGFWFNLRIGSKKH